MGIAPERPEAGREEPERGHTITDVKLRRIISWSVVAVAAVATLSFFGFLAYHALAGQPTAST